MNLHIQQILRYSGKIVALCILVLCHAHGADISFKRYSTDDGLSQISILALHEDAQGMLWIGTRHGLNVFDGYGFQTYYNNPWDSTSLIHNHINSIVAGKNHTLWIGTGEGLCRYSMEMGTFRQYQTPYTYDTPWRITNMYVDSNENLWVISNTGVFMMPNQSNKYIPIQLLENGTAVEDYSIQLALETKDGHFWLAGHSGLFLFDGNFDAPTFHFHEVKSGEKVLEEVTAIYQDEPNRIWLGSLLELWCFDILNGSAQTIKNEYGAGASKFTFNNRLSMGKGFDNTIWTTSYNGILIVDPDKMTYVDRIMHSPSNRLSLSDNSIHSLLISESGDRWVGTYSGGLNYYSPYQNAFKLYQHNPLRPTSLNSNIINAFEEGADGKLYIGTSRGGLNIYDGRTDRYEYDLTEFNIRDLFYDSKGTLWVSTLFNGLVRYDTRAKKPFFFRNSELADENNVADVDTGDIVFEDDEGRIWVGSWNAIYEYNRRTDSFDKYEFEVEHFWDDHGVRCIIQDGDDLWMMTATGVKVFNRTNKNFVRDYAHIPNDSTSLPSNNATYAIRDKENKLWLATYGGLSLFNKATNTFTNYSIEDGLPSNMVLCMLVDDHNKIWTSTSNGLAVYDQATGKFKVFDKSNNLQSNAFRDNACFACSDGEFLFGGINGFNKFNPLDIAEDYSTLEVVLTDLKLFNKKVMPGPETVLPRGLRYLDTLVLNYNQNVVTIGYSAADFFDPQKTQYSYIMEGFDAGWHEVGGNRTATYTNLSPGLYTFKVRAANANGEFVNKATSIVIEVVPPYWQTAWFRLTAVALLLLLIYVGHRIRVSSLVIQRKKLDRMVKERTAVIDSQNRTLEQQNANLLHAEEEVRTANEQLQKANDGLEAKVTKRTEKLNAQNQKIKEYAFLNAHKVRSPLVRILGLINLYDTGELSSEELQDVNTKIKESALELDQVTRKINEELDSEIGKKERGSEAPSPK